MHGDEIDPAKVQSQGAKLLRDFLIFAQTRQNETILAQANVEIESFFENSIYKEFSKRGLKLVPQVGLSGYRIDFGVLDDNNPNSFIIGIECDGNNYHSASPPVIVIAYDSKF